jgi:hypothetical protein
MDPRYLEVIVPPAVACPRGAQWAAAMAVWLVRTGSPAAGSGLRALFSRSKQSAPAAVGN